MWRFRMMAGVLLMGSLVNPVHADMLVVLGSYTERDIAIRELSEFRDALSVLPGVDRTDDKGDLVAVAPQVAVSQSSARSPTLLIVVSDVADAVPNYSYRVVHGPFDGFMAARQSMTRWHATGVTDAWIVQQSLPLSP